MVKPDSQVLVLVELDHYGTWWGCSILCFLAFSSLGWQDTTLPSFHPILLWTFLSGLSSWFLLPGSPPPPPAEHPTAPEILALPSRLGPRPLLSTPEWPHQPPGSHTLVTPTCVCHARRSLIPSMYFHLLTWQLHLTSHPHLKLNMSKQSSWLSLQAYPIPNCSSIRVSE